MIRDRFFPDFFVYVKIHKSEADVSYLVDTAIVVSYEKKEAPFGTSYLYHY